MTQREIERKKEEYVSVLADKTKDIQMQAQSIKNPEDESKNTQIFMIDLQYKCNTKKE